MKHQSPHPQSQRLLIVHMSSIREWEKGRGINRNYHVFQQLQKQLDIEESISIDQPPHSYKTGMKAMAKLLFQPYQGAESGGGVLSRMTKVTEQHHVFEIPVFGLKGRKSGAVDIQKQVYKRWPKGPTLVWSYSPFIPNIKELFPEATWVFDTVDDWREQGQYDLYKEELTRGYTQIAEEADVVFTVATSLKERLFHTHAHAYHVPNGIDLNVFQQAYNSGWPEILSEKTKKIREELESLEGPLLGYGGVIQERLDVEILDDLSRQLKKGTILLVGPNWRKDAEFVALLQRRNVHHIDAVQYEVYPYVLNMCAVGLIPHKVNTFTESMNPLKLYEYLALGKPVVTTPVAGIEPYREGVKVARAPREFTEAVEEVLQNPPHPKEQQQRVKKDDWSSRVQTMLHKIPTI